VYILYPHSPTSPKNRANTMSPNRKSDNPLTNTVNPYVRPPSLPLLCRTTRRNWKSGDLLNNSRGPKSSLNATHASCQSSHSPQFPTPRNTPPTDYATLRRRRFPQLTYPQLLPPRNSDVKKQHKSEALHGARCTKHIVVNQSPLASLRPTSFRTRSLVVRRDNQRTFLPQIVRHCPSRHRIIGIDAGVAAGAPGYD
jgi:hypothetical protein